MNANDTTPVPGTEPKPFPYTMGSFWQPKIEGYRQLSEEEALVINEIKKIGNQIGIMCDSLRDAPGVDQRWLAMGISSLQTGMMQLVRSIAKPTGF